MLAVSEEVSVQAERCDPPEEEAQADGGERGRHAGAGPHHPAPTRDSPAAAAGHLVQPTNHPGSCELNLV